MTQELSKAIIMKQKAKNKYVKWSLRENFLAFKKLKNKCTSVTKGLKKIFSRRLQKMEL